MLRASIAFLLTVVAVCGAEEPRIIAEKAVAAWAASDARSFASLAHPELSRRLRGARIFNFYGAEKERTKKILASGSDLEVASLFFDAITNVAPNRLRSIDHYSSIKFSGDLAIVVFEAEYLKGYPVGKNRFPQKVVLKKSGEAWRFLWSVAVQLYVDPDWNPEDQ